MRGLALHDIFNHRFFFFLLDGVAGLVLWRLWWAKLIRRSGGNQNVPRVHLLFGLTVLRLSLFLFNFDYVITELALDDIADLSGLQSKRCFVEFGDHLAVAKPSQVAPFILAAGIG